MTGHCQLTRSQCRHRLVPRADELPALNACTSGGAESSRQRHSCSVRSDPRQPRRWQSRRRLGPNAGAAILRVRSRSRESANRRRVGPWRPDGGDSSVPAFVIRSIRCRSVPFSCRVARRWRRTAPFRQYVRCLPRSALSWGECLDAAIGWMEAPRSDSAVRRRRGRAALLRILHRRQWGAERRIRDPGKPRQLPPPVLGRCRVR